MFNMTIEEQFNINDRTLLLGKPDYDSIPKVIKINKQEFEVIGFSHGVKAPFISLEIEKTNLNLVGNEIKI